MHYSLCMSVLLKQAASRVGLLYQRASCWLQVQPEAGQARLRRAADEAPLAAAAPQPELKKEK